MNLCLADLFADRGAITADATGVQALAARVMLAGRADAPLAVTAGRFGLLMMPGSRLDLTAVPCDGPMVSTSSTT